MKVFTSTESRHVQEVVTSSEEGGASLNILSGLVAGNFSAYWLGISIVALDGIAYYVSTMGLGRVIGSPGQWMLAPAVFAFGLVLLVFSAWDRSRLPSTLMDQSLTTRSRFMNCL